MRHQTSFALVRKSLIFFIFPCHNRSFKGRQSYLEAIKINIHASSIPAPVLIVYKRIKKGIRSKLSNRLTTVGQKTSIPSVLFSPRLSFEKVYTTQKPMLLGFVLTVKLARDVPTAQSLKALAKQFGIMEMTGLILVIDWLNVYIFICMAKICLQSTHLHFNNLCVSVRPFQYHY